MSPEQIDRIYSDFLNSKPGSVSDAAYDAYKGLTAEQVDAARARHVLAELERKAAAEAEAQRRELGSLTPAQRELRASVAACRAEQEAQKRAAEAKARAAAEQDERNRQFWKDEKRRLNAYHAC